MGIVLKAFDRSLRGIPRSEAPASEHAARRLLPPLVTVEAGASGAVRSRAGTPERGVIRQNRQKLPFTHPDGVIRGN